MIGDSNLRSSNRFNEILNGLVRLSIREGSGFLWQKGDSKRLIWPIKVQGLDVNLKVLKLMVDRELDIPLEDSEVCLDLGEIDLSLDIYFKGDEKDILFKAPIGEFFIHGDYIHLPIPKKAFFKESRIHPRLEPEIPLPLGFKTHNREKDNLRVNMDCRDICRGGIGVSMDLGHAHLFEKGDTLFLEKVGETRLQRAISVEVVYKRQVREDQKSAILMGLRFEDEISNKVLEDIVGVSV